MKKTVLYCDRHDGEHPAVTSVWIKTAGMSRIMRVDVCQDAYQAIVGGVIASTANGTRMLPAPENSERSTKVTINPKSGRRLGVGAQTGSDTAKLVRVVSAFVKSQHHRFTLDDIVKGLHGISLKGGSGPAYIGKQLGRIMRALQADKLVERHGTYGVFSPTGAPPPPRPANAAETAQLVAKCVRAHPGLRVAYLPG